MNGAGTARARARLAVKREANKTIPSGAYATRQVARAGERRAFKMPLGLARAEWHSLNGFGKRNRTPMKEMTV